MIHGLNRHYYSIAIAYRKTDLEQSMLLNLHKKNWTDGLKLKDWETMKSSNEESIKVRLLASSRLDCINTFSTAHAASLADVHGLASR